MPNEIPAAEVKVGMVLAIGNKAVRVTYKRKSRRYPGYIAIQYVLATPDSNGAHLYTSETNYRFNDLITVVNP